MCAACGLPTTHVNTIQTISAALMISSGILSILWVYAIVATNLLKRRVRRLIDKLTEYLYPHTNKYASHQTPPRNS